jgi:hypothetical protein
MPGATQSRIDQNDTASTVRRFVQLAAEGLPQMLDPHRQLFCYKLKRTGRGLVQEGISPRYTAMTLLGLHKLQQAGTPSPPPLEPVIEALIADTQWVNNIGDLGLLLWVCAAAAPERLQEVDRRLVVSGALSRYPDVAQGRTMELAWFLAGISHWALACPDARQKIRDHAYQAWQMLARNQGNGVFAHLATTSTLKGRLRGRIGSFADQVYPIYSLTKFYQAYQEPAALRMALVCAHAICASQGPLGQWWWHYDSATGHVFEQYPVYSVHQHGMAPMALLALAQAAQTDFTLWIEKGLEWINRRNELSFDMEDRSAKLIWRCIQPSRWRRYSRALFQRPADASPSSASHLQVLFECRPYELGWLLYAFAGSTSNSQPRPSAASAGLAIQK